jgi:hypothetical protein
MTARGAAWSFAPAPFRDTNRGRHVDAWGPRDRTAILARVVAADACRSRRLSPPSDGQAVPARPEQPTRGGVRVASIRKRCGNPVHDMCAGCESTVGDRFFSAGTKGIVPSNRAGVDGSSHLPSLDRCQRPAARSLSLGCAQNHRIRSRQTHVRSTIRTRHQRPPICRRGDPGRSRPVARLSRRRPRRPDCADAVLRRDPRAGGREAGRLIGAGPPVVDVNAIVQTVGRDPRPSWRKGVQLRTAWSSAPAPSAPVPYRDALGMTPAAFDVAFSEYLRRRFAPPAIARFRPRAGGGVQPSRPPAARRRLAADDGPSLVVVDLRRGVQRHRPFLDWSCPDYTELSIVGATSPPRKSPR